MMATSRRRSTWLGALALALSPASLCMGHQKWLAPNAFIVESPPRWISFDVTWSDLPFTAESGVREQPIWVVDPTGRRAAPPNVFVGNTKTVAEVELTQPGSYRLEAIDPLTYWTRVEVDGRERWVKQPKNEVTGAKITRSDLYYAKAVAYVTVGEPTDLPPPDAAEPIELIPKRNPGRLFVGEELELQLLTYGKPAAKAEVKNFGPEATGHDPTSVEVADDQGTVRFKLSTPGRRLFACELERSVADDPRTDIHSFNVYVAVWVQPPPSAPSASTEPR